MKVLIAGDYCDKIRVSHSIAQGEYASMFDNVKPTVEEADISIVNFEFPVVQTEGKPIPKCGPNLKGQKKSVDAIKYAGFNVCTLANNHILDQGEECCLDTKRLLEDAGLKTVGIGRNLEEAAEILYLSVDGETLAIINCCEHEFSIATNTTAGANPLNPIQQYYKIQEARKKADYVLAIVHGGHEHYQLPSLRMKETYHFFIDAGADAVVNHHQHCYSGYEIYNGKPIFYGLGNLLFDHLRKHNEKWNEGYMVELFFSDKNIDYRLIPYTQCNEDISVTLMDESQKRAFNEKIQNLNTVIEDDIALSEHFNEFVNRRNREMLSIFAPWKSRITSGLCRRKYLPLLLNDRRLRIINNFIICEAHRDVLMKAVHDKWNEVLNNNNK